MLLMRAPLQSWCCGSNASRATLAMEGNARSSSPSLPGQNTQHGTIQPMPMIHRHTTGPHPLHPPPPVYHSFKTPKYGDNTLFIFYWRETWTWSHGKSPTHRYTTMRISNLCPTSLFFWPASLLSWTVAVSRYSHTVYGSPPHSRAYVLVTQLMDEATCA